MYLFFEQKLGKDTTILNKTESHHCANVLRVKQGEKIYLTNGKGMLCEAILKKANSKNCIVEIVRIENNYGKRPYRLHLAIAPIKSADRFEWFLEKSVECGIDIITPLICEHSERKIIKPERLEKNLIAAMKQSGRAYLPQLQPLTKYTEFIGQSGEETRFIAHCERGRDNILSETYTPGKDVILLIGPEGDFSERELALAETNGFKAISMGSHRLRTETAGIVACVQINAINGLL